MTGPELMKSCEQLAATKGGELGPIRRVPEGGYDVVITCPTGATEDTADHLLWGGGNTPEDALRCLLKHHS
jgi:hypothetical protein